MSKQVSYGVVVLVAILAASAPAQTWPVGLASTLQWSVPTIGPSNLGGVTFTASGNLLLVGSATSSGAAAYSYTPTRDPGTSRIIGLSSAIAYAPTPGADGGLDLHGGIVFWSTYPSHQVGQYNPATAATSLVSLPTSFQTTGGLAIIPPGYPNAGTLLVSSYSTGDLYAIPLTPLANGLFNLGTPTLYANMPLSGSEGMRFCTTGPLAGKLLVANYAYGRLDAVTIDAGTGLPVGGPSTPTVTAVIPSLGGIQGVGIDPVTGDLFLSSYSAGILYRVDGFGTFTALASDHPSFSVAGGAAINLYVRGGWAHGNRAYAIVASASGTVPGTPIGAITVPLNVDAVTSFVLANLNTPVFANFAGTTNAGGAAVATINIPPGAVGGTINLDFAAVLLNPVDFATNALHVTLVP